MAVLLACSSGWGFAQILNINEAYAAEVQAAVAKAWPQMGQIWPGADFSKLYLLLASEDQAWAINSAGLEPMALDQLPPGLRSGPLAFARTRYKDQPAIAVRLESDYPAKVPYAFSFATHEAVHYFVQSDWKLNRSTTASRSTVYPLNTSPLLYRRMLFEELLTATSSQALGPAKFWLSRLEREYPALLEKIRSTDILEGTAQYIETLANAYASQSASSTPQTLHQAALEQIRERKNDIHSFLSMDGGSYLLGSLAGWLLDDIYPDWKQGFSQNPRSLVELLLQSQTELAQELPANHVLIGQAARQQRSFAPLLDPFISDWRDTSKVLVVFPLKQIGSFEALGFFSSPGISENIIASINTVLQWPEGNLTLTNLTVALEPTVCGSGNYFVVPLARPDIALSQDKAQFQLKTLQGHYLAYFVEQAGRSFLCPKP